MDKGDRIKQGILIFLTGLGFVYFVYIVYAVNTYCSYDGCNEKKMRGYEYCYEHRDLDCGYWLDQMKLKSEYKRIHGTSSSKSSSSYKSNYSSGSKSNSSYSYSSSKKNSSSKKEPFHDPADYDSPEDYADDAWGVDFDDWDDAYDYWEDY